MISQCQKCTSNRIIGPSYQRPRTAWGGEGLVYRCLNCGYSWLVPTADAKDNAKKTESKLAKFLAKASP